MKIKISFSRLLIIIVGITLFGCLIDIMNISLFNVDVSYNNTIFTSLFTLITLSNIAVSIIFGLIKESVLGYTYLEIINFRSYRGKTKDIILISLLLLVFSIPTLIFCYTNVLTAILISSIFLAMYSFSSAWSLIFDTTDVNAKVLNEIIARINRKDEVFLLDWAKRWIELGKRNIEFDDEEKHELLMGQMFKIIEKINLDEMKTLKKKLTFLFSDLFNHSTKIVGFINAYKILVLYSESNTSFSIHDVSDSIIDSIQRIEFSSNIVINDLNVIGNIRDIVYYGQNIDSDFKVRMLYIYFSSIYKNELISDQFKYSLINKYFDIILDQYDLPQNSLAIRKAALYIFRDYVILNTSMLKRSQLVEMFFQNLYSHEYSSLISGFSFTVTQIFQMLYFFSFLEIETLSVEFREEMKEIMYYSESKLNNQIISLQSILFGLSENIADNLLEHLFSNKGKPDNYEYFPNGFGVKSTVWTFESIVNFAFYSYCTFWHGELFPIDKYLNKYDIEDQMKLDVFTILARNFPKKDGVLGDSSLEELNQLQSWVKSNSRIPEAYMAYNWEMINSNLKNIVSSKSKVSASVDIQDLNKSLDLTYSVMSGFSNEIELNELNEYSLNPFIFESEHLTTSILVSIATTNISGIVNYEVRKALNEIILTFNLEGIRTLLSEIKKTNPMYRNYTFIDDMVFSGRDRMNSDFIELEGILHSIEDITSYGKTRHDDILNEKVFISEKFRFNAKFTYSESKKLTEEECDKYSVQYRISDGKYKYREAVYTKSEIIEIISENFVIHNMKVNISTNINELSGFYIRFDYSNFTNSKFEILETKNVEE